MFRVVTPPIIRSIYNCNYSICHWSNFEKCSVWSQLKIRGMDRTVCATFRDLDMIKISAEPLAVYKLKNLQLNNLQLNSVQFVLINSSCWIGGSGRRKQANPPGQWPNARVDRLRGWSLFGRRFAHKRSTIHTSPTPVHITPCVCPQECVFVRAIMRIIAMESLLYISHVLGGLE